MNPEDLIRLAYGAWNCPERSDLLRRLAEDMDKHLGPNAEPLHPRFHDHTCWRCEDGTLDCVVLDPKECRYPTRKE
jgi:hypothetical protein